MVRISVVWYWRYLGKYHDTKCDNIGITEVTVIPILSHLWGDDTCENIMQFESLYSLNNCTLQWGIQVTLKQIYTKSSVVFCQNDADKNGRGIVERW